MTKWYPVGRLQKLQNRLLRIDVFMRETNERLYDEYNKRGFGADINGVPCENLKYKELVRELEKEREEILSEIQSLSI